GGRDPDGTAPAAARNRSGPRSGVAAIMESSSPARHAHRLQGGSPAAVDRRPAAARGRGGGGAPAGGQRTAAGSSQRASMKSSSDLHEKLQEAARQGTVLDVGEQRV